MLTAGMTHESTHKVTEEDSAARVSPRVPAVYASARMIGFAEATCADLMAPHLAEGETSLGTGFQFKHEAATPIGMEVRFKVKLIEVQGRRCVFEIEAHDQIERICTGQHERFIVQRAKFEAKVREKATKAAG